MTDDQIWAAIERESERLRHREAYAAQELADINTICDFAAARLAEPTKVMRVSVGAPYCPHGTPMGQVEHCEECYDAANDLTRPAPPIAPEPPAELVETVGRCCCGRLEELSDRLRINDTVHERLGVDGAFCGPWWRHEIRDLTAEVERLREAALAGRIVQPGMVAVPLYSVTEAEHAVLDVQARPARAPYWQGWNDACNRMIINLRAIQDRAAGMVAVPVEDLHVALVLSADSSPSAASSQALNRLGDAIAAARNMEQSDGR